MAQATGGGMAAVIGLTRDQIRDVLLLSGNPDVGIANLNSPSTNSRIGGERGDRGHTSRFRAGGRAPFPALSRSAGRFIRGSWCPRADNSKAISRAFVSGLRRCPSSRTSRRCPIPPALRRASSHDRSPRRCGGVESMQYLLRQPDRVSGKRTGKTTLLSLLRQIRQ